MSDTTSHPSTDLATDIAKEIEAAVRSLREERDTWQRVAKSYQAAFKAQTARLLELHNICVATQAELENERSLRGHRREGSQLSLRSGGRHSVDGTREENDDASFGTATIPDSSQVDPSLQQSKCFHQVEQFTQQRDYGTALKEVDSLLRGPLPARARVEGLLLKSNIMRKSDWLYDALASCSEALELCDHLGELHSYLPRIQYQRGLCYYQLHMIRQARDAFGKVGQDDSILHSKATELHDACAGLLQEGRRSAFESHRTSTESLLSQAYEGRAEVTPLLYWVLNSYQDSRNGVARAHTSASMYLKQTASPYLNVGSPRGHDHAGQINDE